MTRRSRPRPLCSRVAASMSLADYRTALRLLESAIALLDNRRGRGDPTAPALRRVSLELELLRVRHGQAPASLQRN